MENENKNQLQIELKEEVAQGTYAQSLMRLFWLRDMKGCLFHC